MAPHNNDRNATVPTRRRFMQATVAAGVLGGFSAISFGQETPDPEFTIKLGGKIEAWKGITPEDIAGEDNPTLELVEGETYTLYWLNLDGEPHNIAIEDADGNKLQVLQPLEVDEEEVQITTVAPETGTETTTAETTTAETTTAAETETTTGMETETGTTEGTPEGELVTETEIVSGAGTIQGVEFEATSEMATYRCLVHPTTMVGDVSVE